MLEHFKLEFAPLADEKAIVKTDTVRFSILTPQLIRLLLHFFV